MCFSILIYRNIFAILLSLVHDDHNFLFLLKITSKKIPVFQPRESIFCGRQIENEQ